LLLKVACACGHVGLANAQSLPCAERFKKWTAFAALLTSLRWVEWVVYAKKPFGGPQAVLAYLARYTHRVAIANSRLISADATGVTFKWKDYRIEGPGRYKTMTLPTLEFIRRFLSHVLPKGRHRIRHYGLFANGKHRAANIAGAVHGINKGHLQERRQRAIDDNRPPGNEVQAASFSAAGKSTGIFVVPCR
jgi:Putative transposase